MNNTNFYALISRMKYIGRWSLMRSAVPENIQEHSHMVAVIAHALGVIRREVFGGDCAPEHLAALALFFAAGFWPGVSWLALAFLISPYGLPMAAAWLVGMLGGVNSALKDFVFG